MRSFIRLLMTLLIVVGAGGAAYFWLSSRHHGAPPGPLTQNPASQSTASPPIHYPVPAETAQTTPSTGGPAGQSPRPTLDESDSSVTDALAGLFGKEEFASLFITKDMVRRIVVTIDNATLQKQPSQDLWPLKPPESRFLVTGRGDDLSVSSRNDRRYQPYVDLIRGVGTRKLVAVYQRFYPLFQAAYLDLGTQGYFNDRLVAVIDQLLETPDVKDPIKLVPSGIDGRYKYADNRLEALSCGQKILLRMGYGNAQAIKAQLRRLRARLTHLRK